MRDYQALMEDFHQWYCQANKVFLVTIACLIAKGLRFATYCYSHQESPTISSPQAQAVFYPIGCFWNINNSYKCQIWNTVRQAPIQFMSARSSDHTLGLLVPFTQFTPFQLHGFSFVDIQLINLPNWSSRFLLNSRRHCPSSLSASRRTAKNGNHKYPQCKTLWFFSYPHVVWPLICIENNLSMCQSVHEELLNAFTKPEFVEDYERPHW